MDTNCKTPTGITVGLIDSIISICRVLSPRLQKVRDLRRWPPVIKEALRDLYEDKDVLYTLTFFGSESPFVDDKEERDLVRKAAEQIRKDQKTIII